MKREYIWVVWYRTSVVWLNDGVDLTKVDAERHVARLHRLYRGKGGVETFVRRYIEAPVKRGTRVSHP